MACKCKNEDGMLSDRCRGDCCAEKISKMGLELFYLKTDIMNSKNMINDIHTSINDEIEMLKVNLEWILKRNDLDWIKRRICRNCGGKKYIYCPTMCEMVDGGKCQQCDGKGYIWA